MKQEILKHLGRGDIGRYEQVSRQTHEEANE